VIARRSRNERGPHPASFPTPSAPTATVLVPDRERTSMVAFELRAVAGGWDTAAVGPSDHVEFTVYDDEDAVASTYGSMHQLLRLYDCASFERERHPQFLGYDVTERGDRVHVDFQMGRVETTYDDLRAALEAFLGDVFDALDDHPSHGTREEHLETIVEHDVALVDVNALYDDLCDN